MFLTKFLINLYDDSIIVEEKFIFSKKYKIYKDIPQKPLSIIIYDEEIYIKKFMLPIISKESSAKLVENELSYSLGKINNLLFDYLTIGVKGKVQEVLVYYLNSERRENVRKIITSNKLCKIKIFQFLVFGAYKNNFKEKDTIFMFTYCEKIYLLRILNNTIIDNKLVSMNDTNKVHKTILGFLEKFDEEKIIVNSLYSLNKELFTKVEINHSKALKRVFIEELDIVKIKKLI